MDESTIQRHSSGWLFYVKASFAISLGLMIIGIVWLPTDLWIKGYLVMGSLFVVGSTITLAKTLRDDHEARRLINRISDAKTERLLKEYTD
ncbi:MAG: YiaA/YiaB family inner membrane protein [Alcanivorax nanhaiticus]